MSTFSLTLANLGIDVAGADLSPSVLISKRKAPGGRGFLRNLKGALPKDDISRFWIGAPVPDANKIRPLDPDYNAFNDERLSGTHPGWVSSLPVEFGSPLEEHVRTYSRGLYRWSQKEFGPQPPDYHAPVSARPWCTTRGVKQLDAPRARRWVDGEFRTINCPGEGCPFASGRNSNPAACRKNAQVYVWPRWEALAARVEADGQSEAHALFATRVRQFPVAPVKLITGGEHGPSVKAFAVFMQWVKGQTKALLGPGAWPVPLVGLPFTLGVTKHSGPKQYTIYTFKPSGNFAHWLLTSEDQMRQLRAGRKMLFLGGETESERSGEVIAADFTQVSTQPLAGPVVKPVVVAEPEVIDVDPGTTRVMAGPDHRPPIADGDMPPNGAGEAQPAVEGPVEPEGEASSSPPAESRKTIGKAGAEKLVAFIKGRRLEAEPRAIPMATSAVISEAGIPGNLLAEDLIESEAKAVREWASTRATQMPRGKS